MLILLDAGVSNYAVHEARIPLNENLQACMCSLLTVHSHEKASIYGHEPGTSHVLKGVLYT